MSLSLTVTEYEGCLIARLYHVVTDNTAGFPSHPPLQYGDQTGVQCQGEKMTREFSEQVCSILSISLSVFYF